MDEYIKRKDLLAKLRPDEPGDDRAAVLLCDVRRILREFAMMVPAADVVEAVRCKDCKYRDPENNHCDHPMGTIVPVPRKPDDFCSYGERKGGADG